MERHRAALADAAIEEQLEVSSWGGLSPGLVVPVVPSVVSGLTARSNCTRVPTTGAVAVLPGYLSCPCCTQTLCLFYWPGAGPDCLQGAGCPPAECV
jgi:hypothetical protein